MTALITGSFAYDNILAFDGFFEESLIKEKLNDLSISFLCQDMKKNYGGNDNIVDVTNLTDNNIQFINGYLKKIKVKLVVDVISRID